MRSMHWRPIFARFGADEGRACARSGMRYRTPPRAAARARIRWPRVWIVPLRCCSGRAQAHLEIPPARNSSSPRSPRLRIPGKQWDAAVMMFAVLSYHTSEEEILGAPACREGAPQTTVRSSLRMCGTEPAVLASPPAARARRVSAMRARGVDPSRGTAITTPLDSWSLFSTGSSASRDGKPHAESRERHVMRYLFPREIAILLELSGFRLVHLGDWPALDAPPGSSGYAACVVARAS